MLGIILLMLAIAVLLVLVLASRKPDQLKVSRSQLINASAEKLHAIINTPREFERWSPYSPKDPQMTNSYSGPASGVGARNDFAGNGQVGSGSVEIVSSQTPTEVAMRLTMLKPFAAKNDVLYTMQPQANGGTLVTWSMTGANPFITKVVGLFVNMDNMIGKDFADGLTRLKVLAEKP